MPTHLSFLSPFSLPSPYPYAISLNKSFTHNLHPDLVTIVISPCFICNNSRPFQISHLERMFQDIWQHPRKRLPFSPNWRGGKCAHLCLLQGGRYLQWRQRQWTGHCGHTVQVLIRLVTWFMAIQPDRNTNLFRHFFQNAKFVDFCCLNHQKFLLIILWFESY